MLLNLWRDILPLSCLYVKQWNETQLTFAQTYSLLVKKKPSLIPKFKILSRDLNFNAFVCIFNYPLRWRVIHMKQSLQYVFIINSWITVSQLHKRVKCVYVLTNLKGRVIYSEWLTKFVRHCFTVTVLQHVEKVKSIRWEEFFYRSASFVLFKYVGI